LTREREGVGEGREGEGGRGVKEERREGWGRGREGEEGRGRGKRRRE
jgi:hypothetical protein